MSKTYSRRNFLRLTQLGAASAIAFAYLPPETVMAQSLGAADASLVGPGVGAGKYKEAPMLAAMVADGTLPPVEERLPTEPLQTVAPDVGIYGGVVHSQSGSQGGFMSFSSAYLTFPRVVNNAGTEISPDACTAVEISDDATEFTYRFRPGHRWSDGQPFTVDDILWWWTEEQLNTELRPAGPWPTWRFPDNELPIFTKIDDYTLHIKTPKPFRPLLNVSAHERNSIGSHFGQPRHFMSQYHIDHNPNATELAKSMGFDVWHQAYLARFNLQNPFAGKPHIGAWVKTETSTTREVFTRNPYFHQVDQEGNQLPYIDRILLDVVPDATLRETRVLAGEMTQETLPVQRMDVARSNQDRGQYRVLNHSSSNSSHCTMAFNLNHKDPVQREIYNDRRFRIAMSHAINRQEMNDIFYFGLAKPAQATISYTASYFKEEWLTRYADYNVEEANRLLDEMGLAWDAEHKFRLRPDGKRLSSVYLFYPEFPVELLELVRGYWEAVGHELIIQEVARALREERCKASEHDITGWTMDLVEETACYLPFQTKFNPDQLNFYAVQWWNWFVSEGANGEEPPQEWKDQFNRMAAWYAATSEEEYLRLAIEVWQFFSDEVPLIGTIGYVPLPTITKNGLKNVPEKAIRGYGTLAIQTFFPQRYFWEDPAARLT